MAASLHTNVTATGSAWIGPGKEGRYRVEPREGGGYELIPAPLLLPARFADRSGRGWLYQHSDSDDDDPGSARYRVYPKLDDGTQTMTYAQITADRGPIRPVAPAPDKDCDDIQFWLACHRRRALAALLSAVAWVGAKCVSADGHMFRLTAGRPGSWEAAALIELATAAPITPDDQMDGPEFTVRRILDEWLFGDERHVEVAATLADVFGRVVDGRGGWDQVTTDKLAGSELGVQAARLLFQKSRYASGDF